MRKIILIICLTFLFSHTVLAGPFDVVAKNGARGDQVVQIQMMLSDLGYYKGSIDGVYGQNTQNAVKAFQSYLGIPQDGVVTNDILRLLTNYKKRTSEQLPDRYSRKIQMEATAYTSQDPGCGLYTARGSLLRKGLVAVDPDFIPLGTRLYIEGYGYALADDTGGAIIGNKIDLAYESRTEALKFGRRMVTVYILE